ncbi:MAG: sulfurtransferase TusA family protein [Clostridiales bacterium]|nr:sulfurtransferase TusA family protein [Clostridiales bacterium]
MSDITPDLDLDLRGLLCPMPMVRVSQNIASVPIGGVLKATATDAGSIPDITAWAKSTGQELLQAEKVGSEYVFLIRRVK